MGAGAGPGLGWDALSQASQGQARGLGLGVPGTFPPSPARNARVSTAPGLGSALRLSRPPSLHPVGAGERRGRSSRSGFRGGNPSRAAAPALTIQGLPPWTADPGGTAWSSTALLGHPGLGATPSPAHLSLRPHIPRQ